MKKLAVLALSMLSVSADAVPDLEQLRKMAGRFTPTEIRVDTSGLPAGDQKALVKLIAAARVVDDIFLTQLWSGNHALYTRLKQDHSLLGQARLHYFWRNKGPWSDLDGHTAFIPGVPAKKLPGANFYPAEMTKDDFEHWLRGLPKPQQDQATGFFTVIRKQDHRDFQIVPYSQEYASDLRRAATLLREAAALTANATLKTFLTERAAAFLSNDYYASDIAWMKLDAPLDVTIGPYETYNDELFGYKAAFEAYVNVRDDQETAKLKFFADHLQEIENNLPIDPKFRNPKLGASAPIRVVNEVFSAGDGNHGVQTAAYNLPNDERVVQQKGSKRVMLKNVQEAKFNGILLPISKRVLPATEQSRLSFDAFFTHILAHELSHGIGPHAISVAGRSSTPRQELKEIYSAIEEARADITGLYMLQYFYDHKLLNGGQDAAKKMYTTFLASAFRTLRFGLKEAHGKGMALQMNYLLDRRGFRANPDGTFVVDFENIQAAVSDLTRDLNTLEATGDYNGARKMLDTLGVLRPEAEKAISKTGDIPTDIEPVFVTANALGH